MGEKHIIKIYPWDISMTRQWSPASGLYRLRDDSPDKLARDLWEQGSYIQQSATVEMLAHGNPRKAAEFVRALEKNHPESKKDIRGRYSSSIENYLFETPLDLLPSDPSEYPLDVEIHYVQ